MMSTSGKADRSWEKQKKEQEAPSTPEKGRHKKEEDERNAKKFIGTHSPEDKEKPGC